MPSIAHETPMELIRQCPDLVLDVLREVSDVKAAAAASVRLAPTDASAVVPAQFLCDGVALVEDASGKPILAVVIEPQGRDARTKQYSWPTYLCSVRKQFSCDAVLMVVCWNPEEVAECQRIIRTGHPGFDLIPIVAHKGNSPQEQDSEGSRPYLVLFAGYIGAVDMDTDEGQHAVLQAARQLPELNRKTCMTLMLAVASDAARHALEEKMTSVTYRSDFIESFVEKGEAKGEAKASASLLLKLLGSRDVEISAEQRQRVESCTDATLLQTWFDRALSAKSAGDVFD
jgi:hypothetical protein